MTKRWLDVLGATVLLAVFSPVLASAAIAVRVFLGAPVLFRQKRLGLRGKSFIAYKFRTMTEERDRNGMLLPDRMRLTRFGMFLRTLSLDELPQLWNVLVGEMSLVGPRPLPVDYARRYNRFQRRRHEVKPGLTGWAQVNGRNTLSWERRFELDVWYVAHWSLYLDLRILVKTAWTVLRASGISQAGDATMPEFRGSIEHGDTP